MHVSGLPTKPQKFGAWEFCWHLFLWSFLADVGLLDGLQYPKTNKVKVCGLSLNGTSWKLDLHIYIYTYLDTASILLCIFIFFSIHLPYPFLLHLQKKKTPIHPKHEVWSHRHPIRPAWWLCYVQNLFVTSCSAPHSYLVAPGYVPIKSDGMEGKATSVYLEKGVTCFFGTALSFWSGDAVMIARRVMIWMLPSNSSCRWI